MDCLLSRREAFGFVAHKERFLHEDGLLERFGVSNTLEGHEGCVNTLRWNSAGTLLASGSDDRTIKLWGIDGSLKTSFQTGHQANIFGVDFLPCGNDRILATGAGDYMVRLHDIANGEEDACINTWQTEGRVKRLATAQDEPFLFWACSEDGFIREYDTRTNVDSKIIKAKRNLMIKTMAICQGRTELVAVGVNHPRTPVFDRRHVDKPLITLENGDHVCHPHRLVFTTHVAFNHLGTELIVNQGGGSIYVFDTLGGQQATVLENLEKITSNEEEVCSMPALSPTYADIRKEAKELFVSQKYHQAIEVYSQALHSHPSASDLDKCTFHTNRAMGYLCRRWEGDTYASIRDNIQALLYYPGHAKALWRLARAFILLEQWKLAADCIAVFKKRFPQDNSIVKLEDQTNIGLSTKSKECGTLQDTADHADYKERFCGHTNSQTDMKEANFFGFKDQYIVAGSDSGSMVIWERATGNIRAAFEADDHILNVVQPHPTQFMIASSGIEDVVRIWQPIAEGEKEPRRIESVWDHFGQRDPNAGLAPIIRLNDLRRIQVGDGDRPGECSIS